MQASAAAIDAAYRQADALDQAIAKNPIEALGLHHVQGRGVVGQDLWIIAPLIPERVPAPPTSIFADENCRITLLDLRAAPFGVVAAFCVEATESTSINPVNKADAKKSPLFLVDRSSGAYLYPRLSSLPGNIVAGMPTIGLVVFDAARVPTTALELHAIDLKIGKAPSSFTHTYNPEWLAYEIGASLAAPSIRQIFHEHVTRLANEGAARLAEARRRATRNNMILAGVATAAVLSLCGWANCASSCSTDDTPAVRRPTPASPPPAPAKPKRK